MEELISFQASLLSQVSDLWQRYLFDHLKTNERLLGIKGFRGVGKTTLLLQYLSYHFPEREKGLYVSADHPYFYENSLFELAAEWYRHGGQLLLIDEAHKYPQWSRELKLIYDGHPGMQTIFTSSSALDLYRGESDLSRRLATQVLHGLSFREYLSFVHHIHFPAVTLEDILNNHTRLTARFTADFKPLVYFGKYLREGYFPFATRISKEDIPQRLINILNAVLESDLAYIQGYSVENIRKIKKLLGVIADSAPFKPNISRIATKLKLGRNTVIQYLKHLDDAHILHLINRDSRGMSALQKPDKIYFENTCLAYALQPKAESGTIRETFFANQLRNAGHKVHLSTQADFTIDHTYVMEIGGKNKKQDQIKDLENAFLVKDNIEHGFGHTVPLWLFGFLY